MDVNNLKSYLQRVIILEQSLYEQNRLISVTERKITECSNSNPKYKKEEYKTQSSILELILEYIGASFGAFLIFGIIVVFTDSNIIAIIWMIIEIVLIIGMIVNIIDEIKLRNENKTIKYRNIRNEIDFNKNRDENRNEKVKVLNIFL